jgi:hypothetical protein
MTVMRNSHDVQAVIRVCCTLCYYINRGIDWHWGSGAVSGNASEYVSMTWQGRLLANYSEVYTFNVVTVSTATRLSSYFCCYATKCGKLCWSSPVVAATTLCAVHEVLLQCYLRCIKASAVCCCS